MPKAISSSGTGACSAGTTFVESTITTNRSAAIATNFSRVWAPPPPFTNQPSGLIWSAPSIARSSRSMMNGSTCNPRLLATSWVRGEVATQRTDSLREARAGSKYATVVPVPSPTTMPSSTSSAAARAAKYFSVSRTPFGASSLSFPIQPSWAPEPNQCGSSTLEHALEDGLEKPSQTRFHIEHGVGQARVAAIERGDLGADQAGSARGHRGVR